MAAAPASVTTCLRIAAVGAAGAMISHLKGRSMHIPAFDGRACEDAAAVGAECEVCETRYKFCRGHFVYEPITVILAEAMATMLVGALATVRLKGVRGGLRALLNRRAVRVVAPIGLIYIFGDAAELAAVGLSSPLTVAILAQTRLLMVALMRLLFLGQGQTPVQWLVLWASVTCCVASLVVDAPRWGGVLPPSAELGRELAAVPLVLLKNLISCGGAVYSEYFLQSSEIKDMPLSATQFHFKAASSVSAVGLVFFQGTALRILAPRWNSRLHQVMPPGVSPGHFRVPFFGGWDAVTWLLVGVLVANNFLISDTLRRLTSVCKYAATAFTFALTYAAAVFSGSRPFTWWQGGCCALVAVLVMVYAVLPSPPRRGVKQDKVA